MSENKKRKVIWRILTVIVFFVLCVTVFLFAYLFGIEEWKQFKPADIYQNMERSLVLLDDDGAEYACISSEQKRRYVSLDEIPQHVRDAFINGYKERVLKWISNRCIRKSWFPQRRQLP